MITERDVRIVVSENVRKYFKESGMTMYEFVKKAGLSNSTHAKKVMNNEYNVRISTAQRMAQALGIKTIDLFEDWSDEE